MNCHRFINQHTRADTELQYHSAVPCLPRDCFCNSLQNLAQKEARTPVALCHLHAFAFRATVLHSLKHKPVLNCSKTKLAGSCSSNQILLRDCRAPKTPKFSSPASNYVEQKTLTHPFSWSRLREDLSQVTLSLPKSWTGVFNFKRAEWLWSAQPPLKRLWGPGARSLFRDDNYHCEHKKEGSALLTVAKCST